MNQLFIFILGVTVGIVIVWFFARSKKQQHSNILKNIGISNSEKVSELVKKQAVEKEKNMQRILKLLEGNNKATNDDVEKLLGVSNATAERYLNELEKEGVLRQIGDTGRNVFYQKS